jgi:HK97 family phage portal protein
VAGLRQRLATTAVQRLLAPTAAQKQIGAPPGSEAGWSRPWAGLGGAISNIKPYGLRSYFDTYGGQNGMVWVYACASLRSQELAGYQWELYNEAEEVLPPEAVPDDLMALLREPNRDHTYYDYAELVGLDLDLAGTSYWLMDRPNGLGQPLELLRLRPERTKVVLGSDGRRIGYTYQVGGVDIPYRNDEVLRFAYANPLDANYGMGKVEALQRSLGAALAATEHITGFFRNGARISGVLSTSTTMNDIQFERMVEQFRDEYEGSQNAFKILIAEQGMRFDPITTPPAGAGVVELLTMQKGEVLAGFGVPDPLLGGLLENANYKMEEAQHIFTRRMVPMATKYQERMTLDLTARWEQLKFRVKPQESDSFSTRVQRAKDAIGTGATLNQLLQIQGLPTVEEDWADDPLLNDKVVPASLLVEILSQPTVQPPTPGLPAVRSASVAAHSWGKRNGDTDEPVHLGEGEAQKQLPRATLEVPDFGEGWERLQGARLAAKASPVLANQLLRDKAEGLRYGYGQLHPALRAYFIEQRKRVLRRLNQHGSTTREVVRSGKLPKKAVDPANLWDPGYENGQLQDTYLPLLDKVGAHAVQHVGAALGIEVNWTLQSQYIGAARDRLAALVTRINDTTREQLATTIEEGMRRGYSITQLANGVPDESYGGVAGVFDQATEARAETIARSETAMIYNAAANAGYREAGVQMVSVLDGDGDEDCADANGSTWTIDDAEANPIAHPNCVRSFVPLLGDGTEGTDELEGEGLAAPLPARKEAALDDLAQRLAAHVGKDMDEVRMALHELRWRAQQQLPAATGEQQLHVHQAPVEVQQAPVHVTVPEHKTEVHVPERETNVTVHVPEAQPVTEVHLPPQNVHVEQAPVPVQVVVDSAAMAQIQERAEALAAGRTANVQFHYTGGRPTEVWRAGHKVADVQWDDQGNMTGLVPVEEAGNG